ncbi:hypothetical protein G6514_001018 [Epicoccum nigrum]|nr:hypothetical protein G6514_001018 [Epicoccum nigrum]
MPSVAHRLSKLKVTTFKPSYSPTYFNLSTNHIASNPSHPLCVSQRRRQQERPKRGLWWCATMGLDISKSSCVRNWARRRLRHALVEALKAKGYDEAGKLVDREAMRDEPVVQQVLARGRSMDLMGTLRMHGVSPLLPAKFETVRADMRGVVAALVQTAVDKALGVAGEGQKTGRLDQRSARAGAPTQLRRQEEGRPGPAAAAAAARAVWGASRPRVESKRPESKMVQAALGTLRLKPQTSSRPHLEAGNEQQRPAKRGSASAPPRVKPQAAASQAPPHTPRVSSTARKV